MDSPQAPLIGVVADHKTLNPTDRSDSARIFVGAYATYLRCLTAAGAIPVVVPLELSSDALRGLFDRLDGLLLTGGGDMDPCYFDEAPHPMLAEVEPVRDETEVLLTRWAVAHNLPTLGICRGHQVVNVALGGSLIQDIPSQFTSSLHHDSGTFYPPDHVAHEVILTSGSGLHTILGTTLLATNSRHHQAVRRVGEGLIATGVAPDGIIEATENPNARFFVSVQWHPENLCNGSAATDMRPLFRAFADAATAYHHAQLSHTGAS